MRSIGLRAATVAAGLVLVAAPVGAQTKSLYERLGGKAAIQAVVEDFAGRVLADARISKKFERSDPERIVAMLVEQVCATTGGPCRYTGRSMKETHRNMGVTDGEFDALVEQLVASLNHFKVAEADQRELLTALGTMRHDIVEVKGPETGTALPASFRPWKRPPA